MGFDTVPGACILEPDSRDPTGESLAEAYYTYIVECIDGTLYTGWTTDVEKRLATHNLGKGAKYTRKRAPVKLLASWSFQSKSEAMRCEWQIKQLPRPQKLAFIKTGPVPYPQEDSSD